MAADSNGNLPFSLFGRPIQEESARTDELDATGHAIYRTGDELDWVFGTSTLTNFFQGWPEHWLPHMTQTSSLTHAYFSQDPLIQAELDAMLEELMPGVEKVNAPPVASPDVLPLMNPNSGLIITPNDLLATTRIPTARHYRSRASPSHLRPTRQR